MNWNIIILLIVSAQVFSKPLNRQQIIDKRTKTQDTNKWIIEFDMFDKPISVEANSIKDLQNDILKDMIGLNLVRLYKSYKKTVTTKAFKFLPSVIRAG